MSPIVFLPKIFLSEFSQTFRSNIYRKKENKIMRQQGNNQTNPESGTFLNDNRLKFFKKSMWLVGQSERAVRSWGGGRGLERVFQIEILRGILSTKWNVSSMMTSWLEQFSWRSHFWDNFENMSLLRIMYLDSIGKIFIFQDAYDEFRHQML